MRVVARTLVLVTLLAVASCTRTAGEKGQPSESDGPFVAAAPTKSDAPPTAPAAEKPPAGAKSVEPRKGKAGALAGKSAALPPPEEGGPPAFRPVPPAGAAGGGMMMGMGGGMMGMGGMGMGGMGGMGGGMMGMGGGMMGMGGFGGGPATPGRGPIAGVSPPLGGMALPADAKGIPRGLAAGQLTAGSFDDNLDLTSFRRFLKKLNKEELVGAPVALFRARRVIIMVKDPVGHPVGDAQVTIKAGAAELALKSRTDGRAIVVTPWDALPPDAVWMVTVTPPDGGQPVVRSCPLQADRLDITLGETPSPVAHVLDLALVVDTTGSMGDELEYLKSEMRWIATTLRSKYPEVVQRYALIVYRDEGDEYVTRTFPFTESVDDLVTNIKAQAANGGGDQPEAVDKAMESAEKLAWTSGRAARVLIHVADAPPHTQYLKRSLHAVDRLRKQGVAVYPVACSGYDAPCEFHMRASAVLTGGQFLFLTDDSGIGNPHAEPNLPGYHVERLNRLLVRMIAGEVAGCRIEPRPVDILRTVGKPAPRGVP